jgi:hypothetical protein
VWDTNGLGVAGVTVQTSGYLPATTDGTGFYALGVPTGWTGTIVPSLGANLFAPGTIALTNITTQTTNQDFLMVDSITPVLSSSVSGTNLVLNWNGLPGVNYRVDWSTNLVDWAPWSVLLPGTNAPMLFEVPVNTDVQGFFRLGASN